LETISALSTILKCAGAVVGVTILIVGFRESALRGRAQVAEKNRWNQELQGARTRADEAMAKQQPRFLQFDAPAFHNALKGKSPIRVELLYRKDDEDSFDLALKIKSLLDAEGWVAIGPRPIREEDTLPGLEGPFKEAPITVRAGAGWSGIGYAVKKLKAGDPDDPVVALVGAFTAATAHGRGKQTSQIFQGSEDSRLPEDLVKFIIGLKYSGPNP